MRESGFTSIFPKSPLAFRLCLDAIQCSFYQKQLKSNEPSNTTLGSQDMSGNSGTQVKNKPVWSDRIPWKRDIWIIRPKGSNIAQTKRRQAILWETCWAPQVVELGKETPRQLLWQGVDWACLKMEAPPPQNQIIQKNFYLILGNISESKLEVSLPVPTIHHFHPQCCAHGSSIRGSFVQQKCSPNGAKRRAPCHRQRRPAAWGRWGCER